MLLSATFASVMSTIGYVLLALLCLMGMVVVHEFGHYIAGKILGFKINEFAIGFGPRILKIKNKKNGEIFSIRPIPLGGFCQFEGEDEEAENENSFNSQPPWKRLIVLFNGAFFNFLSAILIITLVFTFYGQILPVVGDVAEESYLARETDIHEGDVLLSVNGKQINILMVNDVSMAFSRIGEEGGTFTILRDGKKKTVYVERSDIYQRDENGEIVLNEQGEPVTYRGFGFGIGLMYCKLDFFTSLGRAFGYSFFMVWKILWSIGQLFTGVIKLSESAGGPITIIFTMSTAARTGGGTLAYIVCLISANLAVMNLLPLPALDGSRMLFTVIEWIRKKPLNRKVEGMIHFVGIIVLFAFAIMADVFQFLL